MLHIVCCLASRWCAHRSTAGLSADREAPRFVFTERCLPKRWSLTSAYPACVSNDAATQYADSEHMSKHQSRPSPLYASSSPRRSAICFSQPPRNAEHNCSTGITCKATRRRIELRMQHQSAQLKLRSISTSPMRRDTVRPVTLLHTSAQVQLQSRLISQQRQVGSMR